LSRVATWETSTTDSRSRPLRTDGRAALPGAAASARVLVTVRQITVAIALALNESADTTTTGRR
jgi:hypothetical protein